MKNILIFNDISGLGNCSLAANLPIFTKLGHYCMPLVTGAYSCQTGFDGFLFQRNEKVAQFAESLLHYRTPDALYVGFGNDAEILNGVLSVVSDERFTKAFVLVDPIMGDNGRLYPVFDDEYVRIMRKLVRFAHCITPNLTEACLLADIDFDELTSHSAEQGYLAKVGAAFKDFLSQTGAESAVITGVECGNLIGNVVLDGAVRYVTNERVNVTYSGTGDVFSSVVCGELLNGVSLLSATQVAANFVEKAARATVCTDRRFGVEFGKVIDLL